MEKKLQKGKNSNYEIEIVFTDKEKEKAKTEVLKHFGKDVKVPGFRKGNVPANLVEEQVNPEYVEMGTYETLINQGLQDVLKENKDIKFIGEPYDLKKDEKNNKATITLDVYPEIEILDDKWKTNKMGKIDIKATEKEVEESFINLKKNYADYKDTDKISKDTVSKVSLDFINKKGESLETGTLFIGEPEFKESKFFDIFIGKEKNKDFEIDYKEKDLPATFHKRKQEQTPTKIKITVKDIKQVVLPEFTEDKIKKLFPQQTEVKTEEDLKKYIKKEIEKQKYEAELIKNIEEYLLKIKDKHMKIIIPNTLINEEFKTRMKSLEQRFGDQEKVKQYFQQLGEEKTKQFVEEINKASKDSLEKFFILQKVTEEFKLDIDWKSGKPLEAEKKLYEKVMGK